MKGEPLDDGGAGGGVLHTAVSANDQIFGFDAGSGIPLPELPLVLLPLLLLLLPIDVDEDAEESGDLAEESCPGCEDGGGGGTPSLPKPGMPAYGW